MAYILIPHIHVHLFPGLNMWSPVMCCICLSVNPFIISAGADSTRVFVFIKTYLEDVSDELPNLGNVTHGLEIIHECHIDLYGSPLCHKLPIQRETKSVCQHFGDLGGRTLGCFITSNEFLKCVFREVIDAQFNNLCKKLADVSASIFVCPPFRWEFTNY